MASTSSELLDFVRAALARGTSREEIARLLSAAGWPQGRIKGALAAYAEVDFPVPVPRPQAYISAREAFLYLVLFTALAFTAYRLGTLLFDLIDQAFPDPLDQEWAVQYRPQSIRWAIATLAVAFPLYLWLSAKIAREVARDPEKRASRVRKWLTHIALFVAAAFLLCDLVAVLYAFLSGELTTRFALKVATVLVIAGAILVYYLRQSAADEAAVATS